MQANYGPDRVGRAPPDDAAHKSEFEGTSSVNRPDEAGHTYAAGSSTLMERLF